MTTPPSGERLQLPLATRRSINGIRQSILAINDLVYAWSVQLISQAVSLH